MKKIIKEIQKFCQKNKFTKVVIGISGGIDSAVVASLLAKSLRPKNIIALYLPNGKDSDNLKDVKNLTKQLKLKLITKDISPLIKSLSNLINCKSKFVLGNIASRFRMTILYAYANKHNAFVCGTTNLSEYLVGYFTKFGDGGCDFEPIMHLYKSQVYKLAKNLDISQNIINKSPSATLWPNQTDEKDMGVTYDEIEKYFKKQKINSKSKLIIEKMSKNSYHKRRLPFSIDS
jgi:NAD+ synthase